MRAASIVLATACSLCAGVARAQTGDGVDTHAARLAAIFAWAPAGSAAVARGREVASRFDQTSLWEISVDVNNAFSLENRRAIAVAEEELRRVPGVRRVIGPAQLLDISADDRGKVTVRPILDRGASAGEAGDAGDSDEDDEAARLRVARRADALGWFLSGDGIRLRFLIDTDRPAALRAGLEQAIASSGLQLLHAGGAHLQGQALWPDPADRASIWMPAALSAIWILALLLAGRRLQNATGVLPRAHRSLVIAAAVAGAAGLFALSGVSAVRGLGVRAAIGAMLAAAAALLVERRSPLAGLAGLPRVRGARPPVVVALGAAAVVMLGLLLSPRLRVGTQQWRDTPFLLVSVRGDMDQPVVLREVRRLTDYLRAQPGVAGAWSAADVFSGASLAGEEVGRIPDSAELTRRVFRAARVDPALALELSADHHEGLVVIRFDDEQEVSRLEVYDRLAAYLRTELRQALVRVDLGAAGLAPATRSVGRGLLAADAGERIERICERSGRSLSDAEGVTVERLARQAAVIPAVDLGKLRREIADELHAFASERGGPGARRLGAGALRGKLAGDLGLMGDEATVEDIRQALAARLGPRAGDEALPAMAEALHSRLGRVRRRHMARINSREMLYGADLPTEGVLADEVRGATRDAMGPVVGIPVAPGAPGAFHLDALAVGGAANDRALSDALPLGIRRGGLLATVAVALLLLASGRGRGVLWLPVGLGPVAAALMVPSLTRDAVGMAFLAFVAGALAGGATWAVSMAARRRV